MGWHAIKINQTSQIARNGSLKKKNLKKTTKWENWQNFYKPFSKKAGVWNHPIPAPSVTIA